VGGGCGYVEEEELAGVGEGEGEGEGGVQDVIGRSGEEGRSVVDMCGVEDGLGTGKEERAVALWARDR